MEQCHWYNSRVSVLEWICLLLPIMLTFCSIGDVIDAFMAIMVLRTCQQIEGGLPANVTSKMYFNIILDFGIGLVPFLGDIADALFRANTRNAVVLEKYLR